MVTLQEKAKLACLLPFLIPVYHLGQRRPTGWSPRLCVSAFFLTHS